MYEELLPIGSVVNLVDEDEVFSVMITSRIMAIAEENEIYDYAAVPYPQGFLDEDNVYFFNRDAIEGVLFIGCQNEAEVAYRNELAKVGELKIVDGQIVEA